MERSKEQGARSQEWFAKPLVLLASSVVLLTLGFQWHSFPVFIFAALVPLFILIENKRFGGLAPILFWLAFEYMMVKVAGGKGIFLADAFSGKYEWLRWIAFTGYLGASLWILVANYFLYLALVSRWQYAVVFVIVILGPILYSYTLPAEPLLRMETNEDVGEWIPRTAAWISVLVLLSAFVKEFVRKK